jgi:hypothetical protein
MVNELIPTTKIAVFRGRRIRKTLHKNEWFFSVIDVIAALTESENPRDYWYKMKVRVKSEENAELSTKCRQLKLESTDGKQYETDCADTETVFHIIQSALHFKLSLLRSWCFSPYTSHESRATSDGKLARRVLRGEPASGELAKGWGQIATPLSVQTAGAGNHIFNL